MLTKIFTFFLISAVIYFGISIVLIFGVKTKKPAKAGLTFSELFFDYTNLPEFNSYKARDGSSLNYRYYSSLSNKIIILIHGSGWHSRYFLPLAEFISSEGLAQVFTPDLRGHGYTPKRRGDVDYIGQYEDDLADLIAHIREDNPNAMLVVGGHSSGGGLAIRFGGSRYGNQVDAYILLSPFLKYNAPTMRPDSGGWAYPYTGRIVGLTMLNNLGIHLFDYLPVIEFNMPKEARDGTETLIYSHRLNTAYAPRNFKKDLAAIQQPILVVAGTADDAYLADQFEPAISKYTVAKFKLLPNKTHMGLVVGPEIRPVVKEWLKSLDKLLPFDS
ncbi:MAG: alpha/beta fold hydrolase [Desulfobacterales bacterium]